MTQVNLYDFIGVAISATPQEIDSAILAKYNEARRLVTHHDPNIATQATVALQTLEQARGTLLDPQKRASYNQTLGAGEVAGGLTDPQAILNRLTGAAPTAAMPPVAVVPPVGAPLRPAAPQAPVQTPVPAVRMDAWICGRCHLANPIGTRFCKQCGNQVGIDCPKCGNLMEASSQFCQNCGVNVREFITLKQEEERMRAMELAQAQRLEEQRKAMLGPIISNANNSWTITKAGCILAFIPYLNFVSIFLWGAAVFLARKVLNASQLPGDTEFRAKAKKAQSWSLIPLVICAAGIVLLLIGMLILAVSSAGSY